MVLLQIRSVMHTRRNMYLGDGQNMWGKKSCTDYRIKRSRRITQLAKLSINHWRSDSQLRCLYHLYFWEKNSISYQGVETWNIIRQPSPTFHTAYEVEVSTTQSVELTADVFVTISWSIFWGIADRKDHFGCLGMSVLANSYTHCCVPYFRTAVPFLAQITWN